MQDLQSRLQTDDLVQLSIDRQIYTISQQGSTYTFTNEFGRQETFESIEHLISALQSWYENPTLVIL